MNPNYGAIHQPKIVRNILGLSTERTALRIVPKDSAAVYMGSFMSDVSDDGSTPKTVANAGVKVYSATSDLILGFVSGMGRNGLVPLFEDGNKKGTVTNASGELPVKYTFSSTNDQHNATPDLEFVEVTPIWDGDILEVALWGGSTTSVARGTTSGSDKVGSSFPVNATYTFALTESAVVAANATLTGVQFVQVLLDGAQPSNPNHIYVRCIRSSMTWKCSA